jgi:starch synthase (maltosyl-transferring)
MEHVARAASEEYVDNEKFQLRAWKTDGGGSLRDIITLLNRIRREHPALQQTHCIQFHRTDSPAIIAYSKRTADFSNVVLVVANLEPRHTHGAWLDLDLDALGLRPGETFQVHDLLSESRFLWSGPRNYVELDPGLLPASVFVVRRKARSEHDFEYFL